MRIRIKTSRLVLLASGLLLAAGLLLSFETPATADEADDIRAKITENNQKISDLQKQIDQYSTLLSSTSKEAQTLASALKSLELTRQKLEASLDLTTKQISKTSLALTQLKKDIATTQSKIDRTAAAIAESIRQTQVAESQSAIEQLLNNRSISDTWDYINAVHTLQAEVKGRYDDLRDLQALLVAKKDEATGEKTKLESYKKKLADQKQVVLVSKQEKDKLLADTKNTEAAYKKILAEKIKQKETYEKELFDYESQLKITINPGSIPNSRPGVLSWPMDSVSVTQYFGKTVAAKRLYVSGTHGGIDLRASIGTPIKAALSGIVTDTEAVRSKSGCQYGKWVLIKHPNGLSTIYGHLSVVSVKPGDA
ncbi:peptidoglycan DD-metalloendopeptidase family protein, partial [Candidatus Parcubacteria bacterium]|nr:peptidoglycan DD-metalloendopeptidase family protein [Candidatus Parcubacteria bacterium]